MIVSLLTVINLDSTLFFVFDEFVNHFICKEQIQIMHCFRSSGNYELRWRDMKMTDLNTDV